MYETWIYSHFINTGFFPILVIGGWIVISVIFIKFVTRKKYKDNPSQLFVLLTIFQGSLMAQFRSTLR